MTATSITDNLVTVYGEDLDGYIVAETINVTGTDQFVTTTVFRRVYWDRTTVEPNSRVTIRRMVQ